MDAIIKTLTYEEFQASESSIDTEYFGIPSAKAILKEPLLDEQKRNDLLEFLRCYEFLVIINKGNDPTNNHWIGQKTNAFLADINIQFRKEVSAVHHVDARSTDGRSTEIFDNLPRNNQIIQIAKTFFKVSRFLNDPFLPSEKARCIYGDIVNNAFGKPGRFFAYTKIEDEVAGFLLFSINASTSSSTIELIAVNQDFNRRGIGQGLVRSMEQYVHPLGINTIFVGTQLNNGGALKFYYSNGFNYFDCSSIYHYWPLKG